MGVAQEFTRLPSTVVPKNYNIWLKPCMETFTFRGKVDVTVTIRDAVNRIELNCAEIKISSATFCQKDFTIFEATSIDYDESNERAIFNFDESIAAGEGVLSILFMGNLNDKMRGFYRNRYVVDGETRFGAATQFEATDARRCFPCWDEPALKATFDMTLVVPKDMVALSNTNVVFEGEYFEDSQFKLVKYNTTPLMSTYLIGIAVGEFDFVASSTNKSLPVRIYTPKGKSNQGKFALNVAVKAIEYYEKYFDIAYPLPKIDLIALANFSIGAMENWGIVTFRETALLIDDDNSSLRAQLYVALVVCHELSHMWFGNLVTMEWWTHLWLKEGFANFMEHLATDHIHPQLDVWTNFVCSDHKRAKDLDALENSHPIEVPVRNPNEISEIFDAISYCKGATIIRMLHNWIGDENFRKGTQIYLKKHSYANACTEDLWDALGEATGMPVREVMRTWTEQMGYPVIKVCMASKSSESVTLRMTQQMFSSARGGKKDQRWSVPLNLSYIKSGDESEERHLLQTDQMEVVLKGTSDDSCIKLNHDLFGFYRVQYDEGMLDALLKGVKTEELSSHNRLGIQNDLFALSCFGVSSTTDFLSSLRSYRNEKAYAVWNDLDSNVASLSFLLWDKPDIFSKYKRYILHVYEEAVKRLGCREISDESLSDSLSRSVLVRRAGTFGSQTVISEARAQFEDHLSGEKLLTANLRMAVYSTVLTHARNGDLEKMLQLHDKADMHEERVRIQRCLGCVTDTAQMKQVLDFAMSDKVRSNDKVSLIGSVASGSCLGRDTAWDFVKSNWATLSDMYNGSSFMARLVKFTTEHFSTEERAAEVREFFATHSADAAERTLRQSLESIEMKIGWWGRDEDALRGWFANLELEV